MFTQEFKLQSGGKVTLALHPTIPCAVSQGQGEYAELRLSYPTHNNGGYNLCVQTHTYEEVSALLRSVKG